MNITFKACTYVLSMFQAFILIEVSLHESLKINNMTNRNLLIQQNENDVSIVEPLNNGSFKILSEFKLNTPCLPINTYDDQLYVSINFKNEEINIYNKSNE